MTSRRLVSIALLAATLGAALPIAAAPTPRLILGRAHLRPDGTVVVPVVLKARRADGLAALDFRVESIGGGPFAFTGARGGEALTRARAQLHAQVSDAKLTAVVVPRFSLPLPVLRHGRIASIEVRGLGSPRRVRRSLRITHVTFADIAGNAVRPERREGREGP